MSLPTVCCGRAGLHETLFLGSDTMRGAIAALVPGANFMKAGSSVDADLFRFEKDQPNAAAQCHRRVFC